jgi:hypothetical protein
MRFTQRGFGSAFFVNLGQLKVLHIHKMTRPLNFVIKLSSPNDPFLRIAFLP